MRKLASIQKVWKVEPIEGADKIELAHVLGWQCVINKGSIKEMEDAVYFEVDSFLPVREEFEFLRSSSYRNTDLMGEGFKLRTMKFRGQLSQGLLLPKETFPEIPDDAEVGTDVTELLGVKKWEIEEFATTDGTAIGELPNGVPHTDETRVQSEPGLVEEFRGLDYYITTKMDGSSHSISLDDTGFHVTGHRYEYRDDDKSSFYRFVKSRGFKEKMEDFLREYSSGRGTLVIQGEFCAPGIQKNRLKLQRPEWYVFTVILNGKRQGLEETKRVCQSIGAEMVPVEEVGNDLPSVYPTIEDLLERADGEYPRGGKKEGIVIRPVIPVLSKTIMTYLSMKVLNNKYLLKNEE